MAENNSILDKLEGLVSRYEEVGTLITDPNVISDQKRYVKLTKEYKDLGDIMKARKEYMDSLQTLQDAKEMLATEDDPEMKEMAREEMAAAEKHIPEMEERIKLLLVPADPEDDKNVIMEIRGGTGGDEAALFAGDLFRMYTKYAESQGWRCEIIDANEPELGGFKEVIFSVDGENVYSKMKFESGVHRVQRVPATETQGRVHTSTVTVAVLPEMEDVDIEVNEKDLKIDTYRASGAGGQHINKTESAVRITHLPSGIVVACQDQRSQLQNREKAMRVLRAKLQDQAEQEAISSMAADRKSQVGTGDRSERIRTYNYPQGRVTDHRINLTLYKLDAILNGDLDEIIQALNAADQAAKMQEANTNA